jgi:adenylate kinase family enzyme
VSNSFPYKRIAVIGTSGSGKTTFARTLAGKIGGEHIELDSLFHGPNWQARPKEVFISSAQERMQCERWVVDGNYGNKAQQFDNAGLIIWLDFPFRIILTRVLIRTVRRLIRREELWNSNRETLRMALSRESIILWVFQTYAKRRREFFALQHSGAYPNAQWMRFRYPKEARQFLSGI